MDNIERIIRLEADADKLQAEADELRWEAARLIAEELDGGKSQRQLAREIGKSQPHVKYMAAVHKIKVDNPGYQGSFNDAYQKAKRGKRSATGGQRTEKKRKPAPAEDVDVQALQEENERLRQEVNNLAGRAQDPGDELDAEKLDMSKASESRKVQRVYDMAEAAVSGVPGRLGDQLRRVLDALVDMADGDDPKHAYMRAFHALSEIPAALKELS